MEQPSRTLPRYIRIADALQDQIDNEHFAPGAQLPSERALSETFGVTRMTLRQALDHLAGRGLIVRRPGAGTFVAPPKIVLHAHTHTPPAGGLVTTMTVVVHEVRQATRTVAAQLAVPSGVEIDYTAWRHTHRSQPVFLEQVSMAATQFSRPHPHARREHCLADFLLREYGVHTRRIRHLFEAVPANTFEAQLLGVTGGSALMLERCTLTARDGRPVAYCVNLYRSDRVRFRFDNGADPGDA